MVRFNHMELTFPRGTLTKEFLTDIEAFWCGVFGWNSTPFPMDPSCQVISPDLDGQQFLLLAETDEPMPQPPDFGMEPGQQIYVPHLGLFYEELEEIATLLGECKRLQEKDDRVRIRDFPAYSDAETTAHVFYLHYLIPLWFDVQCFKRPGNEPEKSWHYV